jgi:diamine N-acetyltransferase
MTEPDQPRTTPGMPGGPDVSLHEVDAGNWRDCAAVQVAEHQRGFVMPVSYYLSLCHYGQVWHPLAIRSGEEVVGSVMWAVDPEDRSGWIGGLTIDSAWQGRGLGRAAVEHLLLYLRRDRGCSTAALSYSPDNQAARALYASLGFVETGEMEDDEVIARRSL